MYNVISEDAPTYALWTRSKEYVSNLHLQAYHWESPQIQYHQQLLLLKYVHAHLHDVTSAPITNH